MKQKAYEDGLNDKEDELGLENTKLREII